MRRALGARIARQRQSRLAGQTEAGLAGGSYVTLSKFVRLALQSLALGVGALLAVEHQISPGAIFASTFLISRTLAPLEQVIAHWKSLHATAVAIKDLDRLLEGEAHEPVPTALPRPKGAIRVENLLVTMPGRDAPVLQCGVLSIAAGEVIAVIGPSGAGKSTFARVLAGALLPDRGLVRIDGASYGDWDPERLAGTIGFVPQMPTLLAGTIAENIARFSGELAAAGPGSDRTRLDEAVVAAAQKVGAHEIILGLPGGYEAALGIDGQGLSGGQAQRIALARAVFGDPSVLVLDEPNAHLDSEGDRQLVETLMALKAEGRTIVVVSHKLGILPVVDRILVLREGQPVMFGPREDVMARLEGKAAGVASVSAA
jgi:ATP-binding cassette subfamily C protein